MIFHLYKKILISASYTLLCLAALITLASCGHAAGRPGSESSPSPATDSADAPADATGLNISMSILPGRVDADVRADEVGGVVTVITVFEIVNSGRDVVFGDAYRLDVSIDGGWREVRHSQDSDDTQFAKSLSRVSGMLLTFRLEWQELAPGTYRLEKTFYDKSDHNIQTEAFAEFTVPEDLVINRPIVYDETSWPMPAPGDLGVTLEFKMRTPSAVVLTITNNSGKDIRYGSGYRISGSQWGSAGESDMDSYDLPAGERLDIIVATPELGFGEYTLVKNIIVDPNNPADSEIYKLLVDFAIDNTTIPQDFRGIAMDVDFATPVGAVIEITNGFDSGRIYYDKSFRILHKTGGEWQELQIRNSDAFLADPYSLASRQVMQLIVFWEWLYEELPPGEYRIDKSFWLRSENGEESRHDLSAVFMLDGEPIPETIIRENYSNWRHPFGGITTFRAEVKEHIDSNIFQHVFGSAGMLVDTIAPLWGTGSGGEPYYIWDNNSVNVLDANGGHLPFTAIPLGSIVDITFSGMVLSSYPGQIGGALFIQIVE